MGFFRDPSNTHCIRPADTIRVANDINSMLCSLMGRGVRVEQVACACLDAFWEAATRDGLQDDKYWEYIGKITNQCQHEKMIEAKNQYILKTPENRASVSPSDPPPMNLDNQPLPLIHEIGCHCALHSQVGQSDSFFLQGTYYILNQWYLKMARLCEIKNNVQTQWDVQCMGMITEESNKQVAYRISQAVGDASFGASLRLCKKIYRSNCFVDIPQLPGICRIDWDATQQYNSDFAMTTHFNTPYNVCNLN